jgi:hypothetical protein
LFGNLADAVGYKLLIFLLGRNSYVPG